LTYHWEIPESRALAPSHIFSTAIDGTVLRFVQPFFLTGGFACLTACRPGAILLLSCITRGQGGNRCDSRQKQKRKTREEELLHKVLKENGRKKRKHFHTAATGTFSGRP
jgi:hypothetical protein